MSLGRLGPGKDPSLGTGCFDMHVLGSCHFGEGRNEQGWRISGMSTTMSSVPSSDLNGSSSVIDDLSNEDRIFSTVGRRSRFS